MTVLLDEALYVDFVQASAPHVSRPHLTGVTMATVFWHDGKLV